MSKCILCEKEFNTIKELFDIFDDVVCMKCKKKFETEVKATIVNGIKTYYLFEYSDDMMSALVSLKVLGIKEMADALILPKIRKQLKKKFKNKTFLYMPSTTEDDEERGFRHLEVLFHDIARVWYYPLKKLSRKKQALCTLKERQKIKHYLVKNEDFPGNNQVMIVDDVISSGATIFSAAEILAINDFEIFVLLFNHQKYD